MLTAYMLKHLLREKTDVAFRFAQGIRRLHFFYAYLLSSTSFKGL